ncbi:MAG: phosphoribosylamine--glycine ligase [Chloroflexota bacterium]|nr:phosphoribosylamine--glycine ligase [Chloroflexota bacterium]
MNILLIGSGSREHALAWKIRQSSYCDSLFVAPGNGGTVDLATNLPIAPTEVEQLVKAGLAKSIDLTLVGPETGLAMGVVDEFENAGMSIFGPSKAAAEIESSKVFAKELMQRSGVPSAQSMTFDSYEEARTFLCKRTTPIVIKPDGLTAGKGVVVAQTRQQALEAIESTMKKRIYGDSGSRVVIEEYMEGVEVSVFAFTDGETISPLVAACDYKRAFDGDAGPNTGGMGAYSPPEFWNPTLAEQVLNQVFRPVIAELSHTQRPFRGVLYGGLMLTQSGIRVVEFNARLGDPEAQVILPRLETDLIEIAHAISNRELSKTKITWNEKRMCVGIVMTSKGYPDSYETGYSIEGLDQLGLDELVFHAGTTQSGDRKVTTGGRVLTVVGQGQDLRNARQKAYATAAKLSFQNAFYRQDIADRAIS